MVNLFLKRSSCTCQERLPGHAEEQKCGKTAGLKNFFTLPHTVHIRFFRLNINPKNSLQIVFFLMSADKTYTTKISISILK